MNSIAITTARTSVLLALTLSTLVAAPKADAQQLQKGVSVEMAATTSAQPMPAADDQNAWIVTISNNGTLWFGANPATRAGLVDEMIRTPRNRDQKLYIKADARVPYADVVYVLKAGRTAKFEAPVLLTAQPESPQPGTIVPPKGLEVSIESESPSGPKPALVEVLSSKQESPTLKIDGHAISGSNLRDALEQLLHQRAQNVAVLRADGMVPFAQVVHVIDVCRSAGAKVVLATPEI